MQFIFHSQQVVEGRAHYLLLKISDLVYGFLNIYVPNDRAACKGFWTHFVQQLPHVDHWCMGGDFNMIEATRDRVGGSNVVLACNELASWERLCFLLRIQDAWHLPSFHKLSGSLQFSRSDRRHLGVNLSRIDRI